jgi:hypothetical protein
VDSFYLGVIQNLKPWSAPPPKLRQPEPEALAEPEVPAELSSTALSSQDEVAPDAHTESLATAHAETIDPDAGDVDEAAQPNGADSQD